jgi:hypothetical protein
MSKAATCALEKLLARAENAWSKNSETPVTLRMSEASFPAYLDMGSLKEKQTFHAAMRDAERKGALRIEWDKLAGEDGQILRVVLLDGDKTASILGVIPLWDACQRAESALSGHRDNTTVQKLLVAWREGKRPRGIGPEQIESVLNALYVISELGSCGYEDVPVRQLSVRLFRDSKHIEKKLLPILDYLTQDDETCTLARQPEDVLATLGLVKFPQPVLISGRAAAHFNNGDSIDLPAPYIGLAPQSLKAIKLAVDARYILTVENFTPFNEIARGKAGPVEGVVIYTAGMPSPSFLRFIALLLNGTPSRIPVYHWGDIDLGGFRIADVLANQIERLGGKLSLWNMNPENVQDILRWCDLSPSEISWIRTIALKHGWQGELDGVEATRASYEQEMMRASCPGM